MALFGRRTQQLERELANLRAALPAEAFQGKTIESPFVESGRSLLPWRRREITEAAPERTTAPARQGFLADVPRGGANEYNQGYTQIGGATDRRTLMGQLQQLYVSCSWAGACVDTIARFSSAGGMSVEPTSESKERKDKIVLSAQAQKAQSLFDYVNPDQNFRQLLRGIFTDLLIYGDSFVEVVWGLGEPIALYSLPCPDMLIAADEHGVVTGYVQRTMTNRKATFKPHQVIHIKYDSPRGGLYGLGPTEKLVHPITTWLFTEGLLKATMKKGDPPNVAVAWDINLADNDIKRWVQQYATRNLGVDNVGNLISVKGDTRLQEFAQNKIAEYNATKAVCRDEMCGGYGTPPAVVTIIESGNLGGGTGTSQMKGFKVNTCGPLQELVNEALTFAILRQGFGVTDHRCTTPDIDWRDDETIEKIRTQRVERGGWTINRYRDDIDEPPVDGGDDAVIIQTRDVVLVKDLAAMSEASITKDEAMLGGAPPAVPTVPDDNATVKPGVAPDAEPPKHATGAPTKAAESMTEDELYEAFEADYQTRRRQVMAELGAS